MGQDGNSESLSEMHRTPECIHIHIKKYVKGYTGQVTIILNAVDPRSIGFQCERHWNSQEHFFSFNLTWILPDFVRNINSSVIEGFRIRYGMTGQSMMIGEIPKIALPQVSLIS